MKGTWKRDDTHSIDRRSNHSSASRGTIDRRLSSESFDKSETSVKHPLVNRILRCIVSPQKQSAKSRTNIRKRSKLQKFVDDLVHVRGYPTKGRTCLISKYTNNPSKYQRASYGQAVAAAVQNKNVESLISLFKTGISPNSYNVDHGQFLIHTICYNEIYQALQAVIEYGSTDVVRCSDTFGRTALHYVCWNNEKTLSQERRNIVKTLLQCDPHMLYVPDCTGAEPLSYIAESQHSEWMSFFDTHKECFWPIEASPLCHLSEVTTTIREQKKVTLEIAEMISSGRMHPEEVELLHCSDDNLYQECDFPSNFKMRRTRSESDMSDISENLFDDSSGFESEQSDSTGDDTDSNYDESNELADILSCISSDTMSRIDQHFK
jgi:hypothetical protein